MTATSHLPHHSGRVTDTRASAPDCAVTLSVTVPSVATLPKVTLSTVATSYTFTVPSF